VSRDVVRATPYGPCPATRARPRLRPRFA